jgi:hypothetical protein
MQIPVGHWTIIFSLSESETLQGKGLCQCGHQTRTFPSLLTQFALFRDALLEHDQQHLDSMKEMLYAIAEAEAMIRTIFENVQAEARFCARRNAHVSE